MFDFYQSHCLCAERFGRSGKGNNRGKVTPALLQLPVRHSLTRNGRVASLVGQCGDVIARCRRIGHWEIR